MTGRTWDVKSIFDEALEIGSTVDRARWIEEVCRDRPDLLLEVEKLLEAYERAGDFLERPFDRSAKTGDQEDT